MTQIEFRLLGPLECGKAGGKSRCAGPSRGALLAMLLLHAGEAVSTDRLIDALWGERPPASATNALQAHVAALRRVLDPGGAKTNVDGVLETCPPGYRIRVADNDLDIARFERLVAEGRGSVGDDPAAAARLLREALGLWRGPALADFIFEPFAHIEPRVWSSCDSPRWRTVSTQTSRWGVTPRWCPSSTRWWASTRCGNGSLAS